MPERRMSPVSPASVPPQHLRRAILKRSAGLPICAMSWRSGSRRRHLMRYCSVRGAAPAQHRLCGAAGHLGRDADHGARSCRRIGERRCCLLLGQGEDFGRAARPWVLPPIWRVRPSASASAGPASESRYRSFHGCLDRAFGPQPCGLTGNVSVMNIQTQKAEQEKVGRAERAQPPGDADLSRLPGDDADRPPRARGLPALFHREVRQSAFAQPSPWLGGGRSGGKGARAGGGPHRRRSARGHLHLRRHGIEQPRPQGRDALPQGEEEPSHHRR